MDARDVSAGKLPTKLNEAWANEIIAALTASGYQIIHRDENHGPTLERAAHVAENCPDTPFRESRRWHGDLRHSIPSALRAMEVKHHG